MEPVSAESIFPEEVWGKIFQNLEAKDAVSGRLVCSDWRTELDKKFDKWAVRLDETSPDDVQHLLQLKVKEATILDLSTPVDSGQDGTPVLFKYPELLKKLSIHKHGRICPENLVLLLQSCEGSIKYLDLDMLNCNSEFPFHASYNIQPNRLDFRNLETLKIRIIDRISPQPPNLEHTVLNMILGLSTMRKIKYLNLDIDYMCLNAVSSTVLAFIGESGNNLEVLNCSFFDTSDEDERAPGPPIDVPALRKVLGLKKIKISYDHSWVDDDGASRDPELVTGWSALLEVQLRNLTHLDLADLNISRWTLQDVCQNNQTTLTKLRLMYLMFDFDLEILAHCIHLKELHLHASEEHVLSNVGRLPLGLQKFSSEVYLIDSEDIPNFFEGHRELEDIEFVCSSSGSHGSNGGTAAVLARFVTHSDLSDKLRRIRVVGFNHSSAEDVAAFNEIFRGLQTRQDIHNNSSAEEVATFNENVRYLQTWQDIQNFQSIHLNMGREKGEDGQWSAWEVGVTDYKSFNWRIKLMF